MIVKMAKNPWRCSRFLCWQTFDTATHESCWIRLNPLSFIYLFFWHRNESDELDRMNPSKRNQTIVSFATALPTSAGNSQALPWQRLRVETDDKLFKQAFQIKTKLFNDLFILINVGFLSKVQSIGSVWLTQKSILILQSCQMEAEWRHPNPFGGKQWYIQIDNGAFGIGNDQRWECCHDQCFERKTKRF